MRSAFVFLAAFVVVLCAWGGAGAVVAHAPRHALPLGGSLMLSVSIDAEGVAVAQVVHKPALRVRALPEMPTSMRWRMLDAGGAVVARGTFDPGPMDLDPARQGQPGHVLGDQLVPTQASMNIKVPAIEFARLEFFSTDGRPFGSVAADALEVR